jgi:hypothetical protein
MNDKELISKLHQLREIKPRQGWVFLAKERILKTEDISPRFGFSEAISSLRIVLNHKYAFSTVAALTVLFGMFGFAQTSLPGDLLFPVRKITEQTQSSLTSQDNQTKRNFEVATNRLNDLEKVAQQSSVKNLASAINEYRVSVSAAVRTLASNGIDGNQENARQIIQEVKNIEEKTKQISAMGVELGDSTNELENALSQMVSQELGDLQNNMLTEEQKITYENAKKDYEAGNYSDALEKILTIGK